MTAAAADEPESGRDWKAIRFEYETTQISHRALAKKLGVPYPTLSKRAMREGWSQRKKLVEATARRLESTVNERAMAHVEKELAPWIEAKRAEFTKRGVHFGDKGLTRIEQGLEEAVNDDGKLVSDSKTLADYARAGETFLRMARTSLGMSDASAAPTPLSLNILTNQAAVQIVTQPQQ